MKIWIIGRWGTLALAMQRKCREKGIDFIATSRKEVDLESEEAVKAQFETLAFTHVINCSGYNAVDQAEEESDKAHTLNGEAVGLLARLSKKKGNKLIHFSTDYVFDGKKEGYEEGDKVSPLSEYGKSKELGEKLLMEHCPEACLIRTSWLFGRDGNHFVKTMMKLMEEKETLGVVSDQRGRPTYADDLAEAVLSLLDKSGTYHFANEGETTWHSFAEVIKRKLEKKKKIRCRKVNPITTATFGAKAKRPTSSVLKTEKFSPPHWEIGLDEVVSDAFKLK